MLAVDIVIEWIKVIESLSIPPWEKSVEQVLTVNLGVYCWLQVDMSMIRNVTQGSGLQVESKTQLFIVMTIQV